MWNFGSRLTITREATGTTLEGSSGWYFYNKKGTSSSTVREYIDYNPSLCMEFDLVSSNNYNNGTVISDGTTDYVMKFGDASATDNSHIRLEYDGTNIRMYVNGTLGKTTACSVETFRIGLHTHNGTNSIKYKDLKIYPI